MAKKQFKTESKRILDLMINSIYTHREIFLRELISNASDAIDKLYFGSAQTGLSRDDFEITITLDNENRTLQISDNGCGMTAEELDKNLGTIAKSGTLDFKNELDSGTEQELIGQFGVGFYAAFMVAKRVTVTSLTDGADSASVWRSDGADGFTITDGSRGGRGTDILLELKDNTDDENYDEFLDDYRIKELVKKYSDYIRYPIRMGEDTLNSMTPLWRRSKDEITQEEYESFYTDKFGDWEPPLLTIHAGAEGLVEYKSIMFIPLKAPYDYYTKEFKRGLQLYSNGVLIMDNCSELLSDHFGFVRGIVDTQDISLNISRETLQHARQVNAIAKGVERRIKSELSKLKNDDREKYNTFWTQFGLPIKFGVYRDFGAKKDELSDLLMFRSMNGEKLVTLDEYIDAMPEGQVAIYYASGDTPEKIAALPQLELLRDKGFDVLCLTDDVDEFVVRILGEYKEKQFKSAADDAPELSDDEQKAADERNAAFKTLFGAMKDALNGEVSDVRLSSRLKSSPACVTSEGGLSLEMERVLNAQQGSGGVKANRILELNAEHPLFDKLNALQGDTDKLSRAARVLYAQSLLAAGLPLGDTAAFASDLTALLLGE